METMTLKISGENVMAAVKEFLKMPPSYSVEIVPELPEEWDHIPYASAEEQAEIEEELKDPECHVVARSKTLTIEIP
ncbi:MAG: hypothetical protein HQK57_02565 [Deltaproteobacteria bacterium]|nr:hypothetical protein [Deltaproteobacteria bacterium]MBF0524599.1 hypothetical protein [Deltaproteobacteria bacterium]